MVAGFTTRAYAQKLSNGIDKRLNLYVRYNSMVGLGARAKGHRSGMPSIAIEIINALPGYASLLAAFQIADKFVLIAVRNGVILQDLLFDNEQAAREKYAELNEIPDWNATFAPAAWGIPRAVDRNLLELIPGRVHAVLHPISRFASGIMSLVFISVFALLFLYFFREPINQVFAPKPQISKINPELAAEYKRKIEEKNKELDDKFNIHQEQVHEPIVFPYDSLPDIYERADLCYRAIGFLMQPVTGWNQSVVECDKTHVNATFKRSFGTLDDFYVIVGEIMPGVFVQEITDDEIFVRAKLPERLVYESYDLRDVDTIVREMTSRFQSINIDANIVPLIDVVSNGVESVDIYFIGITVKTKLIPEQVMKIFEDFGGVYMTKVSWNTNEKTWNYEVVIYAKQN
ncbi:MAG: type 4b pilus protein PilO2 [Alphaproteobacteria bacterium]|nr:type 4b pilus protein PilO2 [Alphaproteobacteria bacterium]